MSGLSRIIGYWAMVLFAYVSLGNTLAGGFAALAGGLVWYFCHDLLFDDDQKV